MSRSSRLCVRSSIILAASLTGPGAWMSSASAQVDMPTIPVGNAGNAADPFTGGLYGAVGYAFEIGANEVTNAQYAAFLNAVAKTDTNDLYDSSMADEHGGIARSGAAGSYVYSTMNGRESYPVNYVSYWDACRFANWLHNGQPAGSQDAGTTEDGAYTLTPSGIAGNAVFRGADWAWAVTSEDEWYKAAYHQALEQGGDTDSYWLFPTSSNTISTDEANYFGNGISTTVPVGSYDANFYGAFDLGGNVWEWNDAVVFGTERGIRGGAFGFAGGTLRSDNRGFNRPTDQSRFVGFRVSRRVIEPPCSADYNGDTLPDILDFLDFFDDFGACDQQPAPCGSRGDADLNGDTIVDILDFLDFLDAFGQGCE